MDENKESSDTANVFFSISQGRDFPSSWELLETVTQAREEKAIQGKKQAVFIANLLTIIFCIFCLFLVYKMTNRIIKEVKNLCSKN